MKKRKLLLIVLLLAFATTSWSQVVVSGVVTDEEKASLPGVSIIIKGTTIGVVTDIDGNYKLDVQIKML